MNILKMHAGTKTKFKSTVSSYLQDYYLSVDAAYEDYCVEHLELLKAIDHYELESEDPLIKVLKKLKASILSKYKIENTAAADADKAAVEKPFTELLLANLKKSMDRIKIEHSAETQDTEGPKAPKNAESVLTFMDFLQLTGVTV